MPAFAPAKSVHAELQRGQAARLAHYAGQVTIGSRTYAAAVTLGTIEPRMNVETGTWETVQTITVEIPRSVLRTYLPARTVLTHENVNFKLAEIRAVSSHEPAWLIMAERQLPRPS